MWVYVCARECTAKSVPVNDLACDLAIMPMEELVLRAKCPVITDLVVVVGGGGGGIQFCAGHVLYD